MTAAQLKASILQLAIEGKLVEQDPADVPVSVTIFDGEVPFDLPENWVWARLGDACDTVLGKMLDKVKNKGDLKPYLRNANVQWGKFELGDLLEMRFEEKETERYSLRNGDIVMCEGGEPGRCAIWHDEQADMRFQKALHRVRPRFGIDSHYVYYVFQLYSGTGYLHDFFTGSTIKHLPEQSLKTILLPLPPVAAQKRIVAKIEELLPHISEYGAAESRLTALNKGFPAALKKSILQAAVQGRLVEQDPQDEPVDVPEYEGEVPFDVPEGWKWARLGDVGSFVRGNGIKRTDTTPEGVACIRYGELYTTYGFSFTEAVSHVPQKIAELCKTIDHGDILLTLTGENKEEIGKATAFMGNQPTVIGGDLTKFIKHGQEPMYLVYFLFSPYALSEKARLSNGDIIVHISASKIGSILIPLPPLDEQKRIVARVEELLGVME